ncbi:MAG: hypothetical protein JW763_03525 [candidate division Zixibacteria bacterium]|nr:hypothetical protein [candidate division Zixibacteria bacterium]
MNNGRRLFWVSVILSIGILMVLAAGCANKQEAAPPPQFPGWEKYSFKHFVFHFIPGSYWGRNIDRLSDAYERYLQEMCEFLAMEIPADTIHFYIYENDAEAKNLAGREIPFIQGNQIHWKRDPHFGEILARYLIPRMNIRMTDYQVLHDGVVRLLDYSNNDYHHLTCSLHDIARYIPLDSLIDNEAFERQNQKYREWEAASLVAYITYEFGINRFKMLWQTTAPFDRSVQELFDMDLPTLEQKWHEFALQYYQGINIREDRVPEKKTNTTE